MLLRLVLIASISNLSPAQTPRDLTQASLEDLMNIQVTSVSKKEQKLSKAAAAIFVITQEDIHRSGATNIPDLLRMAPGVDVEQIDANAWAISVRGFNSRYSNKVLVLIDGRTVYTPSFSGVYWEHLDMPLEDIDRIEIIRGPGATMWGANAVNGVISIITKSSKQTKGGLLSAGAGSNLKTQDALQYGGDLGQSASYRVYGKYGDVGNSAGSAGILANDRWSRIHGGFRSDLSPTDRDDVMVQGDLFSNDENQTRRSNFIPTPLDQIFQQDLEATGGDLLARWSHTLAGGSQTSLQGYYDTYRRTDLGVPEDLKTFDLDFQHHLVAGDRNDIVWGLGYRVYNSGLAPGYSIAFLPPVETDSLFSAFIQDEIRISDTVSLTLGGKLEHNPYTGFQTEPSIRVAWTPTDRQTWWAAASKAIRQPSRTDVAIDVTLQAIPIDSNTMQVTRLYGNPQLKNEEVRDYELGYRADLSKNLSLDLATFWSSYRNVETDDPQQPQFIPGSPTVILVPLVYQNHAHAVDYGAELALNWNVNSHWRISPGYSYLHARFTQDAPGAVVGFGLDTGFPPHLFEIRSLVNLPRRLEFDQALYYTSRLPGGAVPGHARLDVRLARRLGESTEISVVGQNLLRPATAEYGDAFAVIGTQAVRSVFGRITWRF